MNDLIKNISIRNAVISPRNIGRFHMRIILSLVFLMIVASVLAWINYSMHFNGFALNDYHEYCQIARNFYEGHGYSTSVLRPIAYKFFNTLPQPEVTRMPVYPYCLSLFFHILGPNDNAVVLFNGIFYVALVMLIFLVALELSENILIGLAAALMTAFMESFLRFTLTAEPNIFYAAMFAAFFYLYLKHQEKHLLQGIFLGVLYQVRANTLFVFIGFLIALFLNRNIWREKFRVSLILTAGFILGLIPYMIRNYTVIGKPFFSLYKYSLLLFTDGFPLYTVWTQVTNVDPISYAISHPAELINKSTFFMLYLLRDSLDFYKPAVLLLLGIGLFLPVKDKRLKSLRLIVIAGIISQTILVMPIGPVPYYYMFFFPVMIAVATTNVKRHFEKYARIILIGMLAVFIYTTIPYWKSPRSFNPYISIGRQVAEMTEEKDIILTDIPWEITWYANRRTIWLPYDLETLKLISRTLKPNYILLVIRSGRPYAPYKDDIWNKIIQDQDFAKKIGYKLDKLMNFQDFPFVWVFKAIN